MTTTKRSLAEIRANSMRLLKKYGQAEREERTPILRTLAEDLVDARSLFSRADGRPDWKGRSYEYRQYVHDIYDEAHVDTEVIASVQASIRYHVNQVIRERLDEETLEEYDLLPVSQLQRSRERRASKNAVFNALTARELSGGALLALSAAWQLISGLDADEMENVPDREAEVARDTLADLARRIKLLQRRLDRRA